MTKQEKKKKEKEELKKLWDKVKFEVEPVKSVEIGSNYTKEFKGVDKE